MFSLFSLFCCFVRFRFSKAVIDKMWTTSLSLNKNTFTNLINWPGFSVRKKICFKSQKTYFLIKRKVSCGIFEELCGALPPLLLGSSELSSSSSTVWADFLLLLDVAGRDFIGTEAAEENDGGVEGGSREEKPTARGGEEEAPGSETAPLWLRLLLNVQALPFILLRLPMELRMTVARLMDSVDRSRLAGTLRSKLVLIRFCKSEEKVPA